MVKVISFCLWGTIGKYNIGAIKNADLAKKFYPDFECWFYIQESSVPKNIIEELERRDNVKIIYREGDVNTCKPMMWRFEPVLDPNVELMMSRDTDTRILLREKLAVDQWINSNKIFHIMRDHPYHCNNILGGMWGMKKNNMADWNKLMSSVVQHTNRDYDQNFMSDVIYHIYKNVSMIHASYHRKEAHATKFPIGFEPSKNFVGEYVLEDDSRIYEHYRLCGD
jgi:hypothetical protein